MNPGGLTSVRLCRWLPALTAIAYILLSPVGAGSGQAVVHGDAYTYDVTRLARVEVEVPWTEHDASPQLQLSGPLAGLAQRWASSRDACTTPIDPSVATNSFEPSDKHDQVREGVGAQPRNGQSALDRSVQLSDTSSRRVGVDAASGQIVVFDETFPGQCIFHGHVRTWDQWTPKMRSALYKAGLTDLKGRIL